MQPSRCIQGLLHTLRKASHLPKAKTPLQLSRVISKYPQSLPRAFHTQTPLRRTQFRIPNSRGYGRYDENHARNAKPLLTANSFKSPGFKLVMVISVGGAIIFYAVNQETVPISGRRRFNCVNPGAAESQGLQAYQQIVQEEGRQGKILPSWDPRVRQVTRVLGRLIEGGKLGSGGVVDGAGWEVHVIEDPSTQNAFVLPGGKVFVYSGILPICATDDGLAAVLGHEIAHNLAQHAAERMSQAVPITILSYILLYLDMTGLTMGLGRYVGGLALDLGVMRPASRQQESEADYIGLLLMAESCYDPRAAVGLWQRMERAQQGAPPEWMSTHPSNENRIARIQEWLPKAEAKSQESGCSVTKGYAQDFRGAVGLGKSPFFGF